MSDANASAPVPVAPVPTPQVFGAHSTAVIEPFRAAKRELSRRYLQAGGIPTFRAFAATSPAPDRNVVGVAIGEKISEGKPTGALCVKLLVRIKYPVGQIGSNQVLPKAIDGLPTDVEQVGTLRSFVQADAGAGGAPVELQSPNPRTRIRPAQPGGSVGFRVPNDLQVMAGTFGALVEKDGNLFILSNNHVLADESRLEPGALIYQPGLLDGGDVNTDQIAKLTRAISLDPNNPNKVDCAIAQVMGASQVSNAILQIGAPQGTAQAARDMVVHKFGRTTNYTAGRIVSVDADVTVGYETGDFTFHEQILIVGLGADPFSAAGDSGSLIVERSSQKAVGLLFAGSASHTIANHIEVVLSELGVTLA